MTVHEILLRQSWQDVKQAILKLYPRQRRNLKHRRGYCAVFRKVQNIQPADTGYLLRIEDISDEENSLYYDVYYLNGIDHNDHYSLAGDVWANIMGLTVSESLVQQFGEPAIVVHCLYEMTFYGFTEEKIRRDALISEKEGHRFITRLHNKHIYSGKRFHKRWDPFKK